MKTDKKEQEVTVAVVLHPLNMTSFLSHFKSFYRPYSFLLMPLMGRFNQYYVKNFFSKLHSHRFMRVTKLRVGERSISVIGIMCPLFPEQMISSRDKAVGKILDAVRLSKREGAEFVALAGFSSIVTNGGSDIVENVKDMVITSGNTLTASLIIDGVRKALELFSKKIGECEMSIIGATGDIGSICAEAFFDDVKRLVLCSRNIKETDSFVQKILSKNKTKIHIEQNVKRAVKNSDIVIAATSAFSSLLDYNDFKSGAIVCDASIPPSVAMGENGFKNNIFVFDGGRAQIKDFDKINNVQWRSLFPNNSIYGCLSEAIVLALEGRLENYSLGKGNISIGKIQEIKSMAVRNGVCLANFYHDGKKVNCP